MKRRWPGTAFLPGMNPFPDGWRPSRSRKLPPPRRAPPPSKIAGQEGILIIDDPETVARTEPSPEAVDRFIAFAAKLPDPETSIMAVPSDLYRVRALADAALAGRSVVLWTLTHTSPPPAEPSDPELARAYRVARDRYHAQLHGWRDPRIAAREGADNRSARKARKLTPQ